MRKTSKTLWLLAMLVLAQLMTMPLQASTSKIDDPTHGSDCSGLDEYLAPRNILEIDRGQNWPKAFEAVKQCLLAQKLSPKPEFAGKLATLVTLLAPDEDFDAVFGSPDEEFTDEDLIAFVGRAYKSDNNDGWSEYAMGRILYSGWFGHEQNSEVACELFGQAYEKGAGLAAYNLYDCFFSGVAGAPDKSKAYGLLKSAADAGDPRALMELGRLAAWPEEDDNTKPNIAKAKHYLRAAMARGHSTAADILVFVLLQESDDRQSAEEALDILDAYSLKQDYRKNFDTYAIRETFILVNLGALFKSKIEKLGLQNKLDRSRALRMLADRTELGITITCAASIILSQDPFPYEFMTRAEFLPTLKLLKEQASDSDNDYFSEANAILFDYYHYGVFEARNLELSVKFGAAAAKSGAPDVSLLYAERLFDYRHVINHDNPAKEAIKFALNASQSNSADERSVAFNLAGIIYEHLGEFENARKFYKKSYDEGLLASERIGVGASNLLRLELQLGDKKNNVEERKKLFEMARNEDPTDMLISYDLTSTVSFEDWLIERKAMSMADVFQELGWLYRNQSMFENENAKEKARLSFKNFWICQTLSKETWMTKQCEMARKDLALKFVGEEEAVLVAQARREMLGLPKEYVAAKNDGKAVAERAGKSLALIFYADEYQSLENLVTPKNDANRLSSVLNNKYGYETKVISNPDRKELIQELNAAKSLEENDKLIVYFAGHGKSEANTSFWLPVDASPDDDTQWLEDNTIKRAVSIHSKHSL